MKIETAILIVKKLIENNDLKDEKSIFYILEMLLDSELTNLYYFDSDICCNCGNCVDKTGCTYYCNLELELVEINKLCYPIQYIVGLIYEILLDILETKPQLIVGGLNQMNADNQQLDLLFEIKSIGFECFSFRNKYAEFTTLNKYETMQLNSYMVEILNGFDEMQLLDLLVATLNE